MVTNYAVGKKGERVGVVAIKFPRSLPADTSESETDSNVFTAIYSEIVSSDTWRPDYLYTSAAQIISWFPDLIADLDSLNCLTSPA
mgnify:CR=1 FL=1